MPEEIRTARLLLRPLQLSDVADVIAYADDPEWAKFLPVPSPYTKRDAEQFLARWVLTDRSQHANWAITFQGRVIGGINIRFFHDHRIGELGYSCAREHWSRGYTTEATGAIIDAAFSSYDQLVRVRSHADVRNVGSIRVMEKVGMTREGCLRSNRYIRDEFVDDVCYGLLRSEWSAGRA